SLSKHEGGLLQQPASQISVLLFLSLTCSLSPVTCHLSPALAQPHAYVTNEKSDDLSVIDTATDHVIATVKVGQRPRGVTVAPDGKLAYVSNERSSTVLVVDTAANAVLATIQMGERPVGIAVLPDGKKIYVAHGRSHDVRVIDTATNAVLATIPLEGERAWWVA